MYDLSLMEELNPYYDIPYLIKWSFISYIKPGSIEVSPKVDGSRGDAS